MCQGLLDARRDKMQGASGWQSPTINSQVPGWAMASGSRGWQISYTSNHAYSAVYSKWDHNRPLPVHAVLSDYVSNKLSGCFQFVIEQLSNTTMHVCRGSLHLPPTPAGCSSEVDGLRNDTLVESAPETKTTHADRCYSYTILLTTGQQKSSHASDKGA